MNAPDGRPSGATEEDIPTFLRSSQAAILAALGEQKIHPPEGSFFVCAPVTLTLVARTTAGYHENLMHLAAMAPLRVVLTATLPHGRLATAQRVEA